MTKGLVLRKRSVESIENVLIELLEIEESEVSIRQFGPSQSPEVGNGTHKADALGPALMSHMQEVPNLIDILIENEEAEPEITCMS